ncbi:MAG TPA: LysM peptidoglycan-binding domain-containing protein [Flavobacterium sp.]|nr:LysM peptidoglycan-binding domain-containing protein [Flavobacterium sp.]
MNSVFKITFIFLCAINLLFAQPTNYKKHTVQKGETITQIAQKYKVTPYDIYRLNPDAQNGIQENAILLIPSTLLLTNQTTSAKTHQVQPKETLFGIAKQYNMSVEELEKLNPEVKEGLKIGQLIQLKTQKAKVPLGEINQKQVIYHEVQPKETLYSIAKQYNTTVEILETLNPAVKSGLSIGQQLVIGNEKIAKNDNGSKMESKPQAANYLTYEVKPKETLFGLAKMFRMSQEELIVLNPELKEGVREGMVIKVPANVSLNSGENNEIKDLTKSISNSGRKELVLLLPFNISTIESDTTLSTQDRLKRDGFLNMTLDFYSGALMAIDSVKRLGLNFNVKIIDSKETKSSSAISSIIRSNNLENADAVIGPFYPQYVEQTAELLNASNVPVISPLRETSKSYSNLFQSMPPGDLVKNTMFDFIRAKNGNMIALIDKKKLASKQYIEVSHRDVFIAPLNENGTVIADSITPRLVSNKTNYFILETASTGMIFSAISQCNTARTNGFNVELVVLDINSTFESDEVFQKIIKQKIIFPSLTKYQETPESIRFASNYKKINNVNPNQYAIRGFDVVFDTMLRLSQAESFEQTIQNTATEGVENKFDYEKKLASGYTNKGVYIMYYDEDLTVKTAE